MSDKISSYVGIEFSSVNGNFHTIIKDDGVAITTRRSDKSTETTIIWDKNNLLSLFKSGKYLIKNLTNLKQNNKHEEVFRIVGTISRGDFPIGAIIQGSPSRVAVAVGCFINQESAERSRTENRRA